MAAVIERIDGELREIGYSADTGSLAWMNDRPLPITISSYNTYDLIPVAAGQSFTDFVLKADVTWDSTSGFIICGFWFRAQGDDIDAEHYKFQTIRLSGWPSWDVEYWDFNRWKATISPGGKIINTPHIDQEQGSTNTFILAAEGNLMTIYANGHRLGKVTINSLNEGLIGLYGWQDTGDTTCAFDNVWLWDLTGRVTAVSRPVRPLPTEAPAVADTGPDYPFGWLGGPNLERSEYSGEVGILGWAADDVGIARVEIYLDGALFGHADYGQKREHLADEYPDLPGSPNFGFVFEFDSRTIPNGTHRFYARAVDRDGNATVLDPGEIVLRIKN
jgi:hypothetical protein